MRESILPEAYAKCWHASTAAHKGQWLTTLDVARLLQVTADGVRWLARRGLLAYEETHSGQRFFRYGLVMRLVEQRAVARIQQRGERLAAVRTRMVKAGGAHEPRQLVLDFSARLKLVGSRGRGRKVA